MGEITTTEATVFLLFFYRFVSYYIVEAVFTNGIKDNFVAKVNLAIKSRVLEVDGLYFFISLPRFLRIQVVADALTLTSAFQQEIPIA